MLGLGNTLSGGIVPAAAAATGAPVTDGLVGYFKADEGITTDTSAGTITVSQWDNVASDSGGEADQTWNLTQGTKGNQPLYDASAKTVYFDGADYLGGVSGKMPWNADWSIVFIADGSNRNVFAVFAGGSGVQTYLRFHTYNYIVGPRMNSNNIQWGTASGSGDTDIFSGDYNVLGTTFDASQAETNYDNYGFITNQYLLTAGDDCDHSNCVGVEGNDNYSAPQDSPFTNIGVYSGGTLGAQYYAREVMIFNKILNQTEVTTIYNYADSIVTLNEFTF